MSARKLMARRRARWGQWQHPEPTDMVGRMRALCEGFDEVLRVLRLAVRLAQQADKPRGKR